MKPTNYRAFWITEQEGRYNRQIIRRSIDELPAYNTLIRVHYSSLNYKDALSINGNKGITKKFPHQPGIDAAGEIVASDDPKCKIGDRVIVTGYDLGMNTSGGLGEYICVPSEWIIPLPAGMSLKQAMMYGTAGFTAALGLWLLERNGQQAEQGPVVVTGATGGVGSLATAILAKAGYEVIATTGSKDTSSDYLRRLGASQIEERAFADIETDKLLLRSKWAGAIDTVGGNTLHTLLKACKPYGNVACCGLVQSADLPISVYPFIINGISLLGIATAANPLDQKKLIWEKLANEWNVSGFEELTTEISIEEISDYVDRMMEVKTQGRIVVNMLD